MSDKQDHERLPPSQIPPEYYDFAHYVTKERMITYWHQADEILKRRPPRVLEIGIGNGIIASILRAYGIGVTTADINAALKPDVVASVTELQNAFAPGQFPLVLCARVLQHLPFAQFPLAMGQLAHVSSRHVLLTLPVETLRLYIRLRLSGRRPGVISIPFPLALKRLLQGRRAQEAQRQQNFWKINQGPETAMPAIRRILQQWFELEASYQVPEDMSHAFFVLRRK